MTLYIEGAPKAQGRPRFTTVGGFARAYDPKESRDFKQKVASIAVLHKCKPLDGAVKMTILALVPRPQRLMRKSDPDGRINCITKPDCSNYAKGIEDALNGIAYKDDSQIAELCVRKQYCGKQEAPCTIINIQPLEEP